MVKTPLSLYGTLGMFYNGLPLLANFRVLVYHLGNTCHPPLPQKLHSLPARVIIL